MCVYFWQLWVYIKRAIVEQDWPRNMPESNRFNAQNKNNNTSSHESHQSKGEKWTKYSTGKKSLIFLFSKSIFCGVCVCDTKIFDISWRAQGSVSFSIFSRYNTFNWLHSKTLDAQKSNVSTKTKKSSLILA